MDVRRARRFGCKAAILVIVIVVTSVGLGAAGSPGAEGRRSVGLPRAETAARTAVLEHRSYRIISSTRTGLVTRRCWRAPAARVRCSLYVVAANPCALNRDAGGLCAQALWERRWLVEVRRERRGVAARILKISSGPSAG